MIVKELDAAITALGFSSKMCRNAKEELIAEGMITRQCLSAQSEEDGRKGVKWILRASEKPYDELES